MGLIKIPGLQVEYQMGQRHLLILGHIFGTFAPLKRGKDKTRSIRLPIYPSHFQSLCSLLVLLTWHTSSFPVAGDSENWAAPDHPHRHKGDLSSHHLYVSPSEETWLSFSWITCPPVQWLSSEKQDALIGELRSGVHLGNQRRGSEEYEEQEHHWNHIPPHASSHCHRHGSESKWNPPGLVKVQ